ncbi:MAG: type II toxin-antitoxin system RelE/ParE family toxin [Planctomycetes bacterium]|nr:type II toxin-antitoxin system RelE/ParE family toxin [Planctomycetota bacterium]
MDVRLRVVFFKTEAGSEPVRDWLLELDRNDRKAIGEDIKTVQFGWPLGMPLVRKLDSELWEVRTRLHRRNARVIVTIQSDVMILLHGFIKKSQKTPVSDLTLAKNRLSQFKEQSL